MARSVTVAVLRARAKQRADKVNASTPTDAEWNYLIDEAYCELYDLLVNKGLSYFETVQTITGDGTVDYNLPAGHYATIGVSYVNGDSEELLKLVGFRGKFRYSTAAASRARAYRIVGTTVELYPPPSGGTYKHYYAPAPTSLDDDADTIDGVSGWESYVIVTAVIKALEKEESPVDDFKEEQRKILMRIDEAAENRNLGDAGQVDDVELDELADMDL